MHSISFQNPAKNLKSGVDSRGGTQVRGGKSPFPRVLYETLNVNVSLRFHVSRLRGTCFLTAVSNKRNKDVVPYRIVGFFHRRQLSRIA